MKSQFARLRSASAASDRLHRRLRRGGTVLAAAVAALVIMPAFSGTASAASSSGAVLAASVSPTAQLVFDDYRGDVYSIQVYGINQNGQTVHSCWTTPATVNLLPNWWWSYGTQILYYRNDSCSSPSINTTPLSLTDSPTDPPYHCQEDVSPFSDWNPGSNWQNCAIWPAPNGVWYGYATGSLVWYYYG
jgi:hypothetical protein